MKRKKKHIPIPQSVAAAATAPVTEPPDKAPSVPTTTENFFQMFIGAQKTLIGSIEFWAKFQARLQTYRRIYPERYAHVVAFTENLSDSPSAEEMEKILENARKMFGE